ncbi:MAG: iron-containing alcohol dehydrogenase, partial [Candidatus Dormibacteria bacterium]
MISTHVASPVRRVRVGPGALDQLPAELAALGVERPLLACSRTLAAQGGVVERIRALAQQPALPCFTELSQHTPEASVEALGRLLRQQDRDGVISLGGGSVIDGVKVAIHRSGLASRHLAVPTTLSGAEFTPTAGITASASGNKVGLRVWESAPQTVILDPRLCLRTPLRLWLASGVRALDHAVETAWSPEHDPLLGMLAQEAAARLWRLLPECRRRPRALEPRQGLQVAAWWAALGLAGASMGPSHTLSRLLGARFGIPHGIT